MTLHMLEVTDMNDCDYRFFLILDKNLQEEHEEEIEKLVLELRRGQDWQMYDIECAVSNLLERQGYTTLRCGYSEILF